jgi:hypothetical protein
MIPLYFCGGFAVLFVVLMGLAIRNMVKVMDIDSFDDAKGRMAAHLIYGVGASLSGLGFLISLLLIIIDYIKR